MLFKPVLTLLVLQAFKTLWRHFKQLLEYPHQIMVGHRLRHED